MDKQCRKAVMGCMKFGVYERVIFCGWKLGWAHTARKIIKNIFFYVKIFLSNIRMYKKCHILIYMINAELLLVFSNS